LSEVSSSSIAVLRANAMGDYLVSEPALVALRVAAAPQARITLRARCFDLAVQRHGGRHNNPMALSLGAVFTAGLQAHDAPTLDHNLAYQYWQHEVLRYLDVIESIGTRPLRTQPRFSVLPGDLVASERAFPSPGLPIFVLHMVSTAPVSRRINWVCCSWVTAVRYVGSHWSESHLHGDTVSYVATVPVDVVLATSLELLDVRERPTTSSTDDAIRREAGAS
jgi:hypothetical protein